MQVLPHLLSVGAILTVAIVIVISIPPCSANPTTQSFSTINTEADTTTALTQDQDQNIETTIRTETVYADHDDESIDIETESTGRSVEIESRELHYVSPETSTSTPQQVLLLSTATVENATESQLREHEEDDGDDGDHKMSSLKPSGPLTLRQEEVIKELNDIWNYSASLNDTDKELKTSLSNMVQLAYARLSDIEPNDTVDRLKYLLKKLRQRIGFPSPESDDDDVELEHRDESNDNNNEDQKNTSPSPPHSEHMLLLNSTSNNTDDDENDDKIQSTTTTLQLDDVEMKQTDEEKSSSTMFSTTVPSIETKNRSKRGLGTGIGEYESVPMTSLKDDDDGENSLYSNFYHYNTHSNHESTNSFDYNHDDGDDPHQVLVVPTATPGEKTIQKIILVQDMMTRSPVTVVSNQKPMKNLSPPDYQSTESSSSSTIFLPPLKILPQPNIYNNNNNLNMHKNHKPQPIQNQTPPPPPQQQPGREPVSVEQIALAIVKLLYPTLQNHNNNNNPNIIATENYSTAPQPSSEFPFPVHKDMFLNKLSLLNTADHNQLQQSQSNNQVNNMFHLTTTKPHLYPTYLQVHPLPLLLAVANNNNNHTTTNTVQNYPPLLQQLIASQMQVSHPPETSSSPPVSVEVDLIGTSPIPISSSLKDESETTMDNKISVAENEMNDDTNSENLVEDDPQLSVTLGTKLTASLTENEEATTSKSVETTSTEMMTSTTAAAAGSSSTTMTTTTPPPVQVMQIIEELSDSNLMAGPTAFINGTREGLVQFIATLSTLSFTTKMVMVFALSISALSIILGVYSLGPPIIAVGILGILIPIAILLLLQDSNKSKSQNPQGKIMEELKDEMFIILDLIENAFKKYGQTSYSDQ